VKHGLLPGATGYIGPNTTAPLVAKGYAVYAVIFAQEIYMDIQCILCVSAQGNNTYA
jgi:hypothetical protein